ncbi:hypothetical protein D3C81_1968340 [compost metagenome]
MDVDLFLIELVLKAQFVESIAFVGLALDRHPRLVLRQGVRRQVRCPVRSSGNDRLVAIAVQEVDDHFLPDARDRHMAPGRARPVLRHADPARAVFVVLAQPVPRKLDLYAPVLVAIDLFIGRAHD